MTAVTKIGLRFKNWTQSKGVEMLVEAVTCHMELVTCVRLLALNLWGKLGQDP